MNALISAAASAGPQRPASVFAGIDVCREAGLTLPEGARRPVFEDEEWDFTDVIGLPVQMPLASRRFDFTAISDPRRRLPCPAPTGRRPTCEPPRGGSMSSPGG